MFFLDVAVVGNVACLMIVALVAVKSLEARAKGARMNAFYNSREAVR